MLVVEDDPMIAAIHERWVAGELGFEVVATVPCAERGVGLLSTLELDLIVLDLRLDAASGMDLLQELRRRRSAVDAIVVSAVHDSDTVQEALRLGAVDYLVKPFTRGRFQEALAAFAARRSSLARGQLTQADIDVLLTTSHATQRRLPKGLSAKTLACVNDALQGSERLRSADDVAAEVGLSRVAVRRYLDYLLTIGSASLELRYGSPGRPKNLYRPAQP